MWTHLDDPRGAAKQIMRSMVDAERLGSNEAFIRQLRQKVGEHPIKNNPARKAMLAGQFGYEKMKRVHLEYRHAIVQIFTDALTVAQFNCVQLEDRGLVPSGGKLAPRFLINLNNLDEFGYRPGLDKKGYYQGNPAYAHYPLFEQVMSDFGVTQQQRLDYKPSYVARAVRQYLLNAFDRLEEVVTLLAVGEVQVILFSNPLRVNADKVGVTTGEGYYQVHGTDEHGAPDANDDDHEDDCWAVLAMSIGPADHARIESLALGYMDIWDDFWSAQMNLAEA